MHPTDDTIAAISTAAGPAARAIVRLSGPGAAALAGRVFATATGLLDRLGGFRAAEGVVRLSQPAIEAPARAYVFRAPRSYTRQDVVELHVPGSGPLAEAVLAALVEAGARPAEAGEFTARAFFSGRIDLSRAEAVADLISAADDAQARAALAALGGAVHRIAQAASEALAGALASVEASIDLGDEELPLPPPRQLAGDLGGQARKLRQACSGAADTPDAARQPRAVLAGRPNVGKSSLLNCLTGTDRAIVSALAGTTRDVLSAPMSLGGASLLLQDAAGFVPAGATEKWHGHPREGPVGPAHASQGRLAPANHGRDARETHGRDGHATPNELAALAHAAARQAVARADIIVFVLDLSVPGFAADLQLLKEVRSANPRAPIVLAGNKSDLIEDLHTQPRLEAFRLAAESAGRAPTGNRTVADRPSVCAPVTPTGCGPDESGQHTPKSEPGLGLADSTCNELHALLAVSCVTGKGLAELRSALAERLHLSAGRGGELLGLHDRQKRCLLSAADAADRAAEMLSKAKALADVAELCAVELREALSHLGQISGQVVTEDILGRIFARFCVGK